MDTERLKQFGDTVTAHFTSVKTKLGQHLDALNGTRWEGEAKTTVSRTVGTATDNAQGVCDTVLKQLNQRITEQATATETADRASY